MRTRHFARYLCRCCPGKRRPRRAQHYVNLRLEYVANVGLVYCERCYPFTRPPKIGIPAPHRIPTPYPMPYARRALQETP